LARVLNLKSVAFVFYFCLLLVVARMSLELYFEPASEWLFSVIRYLRQTLISGLLLLLAIGFTEAFVAARSLSGRRALSVGIVVAALAAAVSLPVRLYVAGAPVLERLLGELNWVASVWALWTVFGSLAYWFFYTTREDEAARAALADSTCRREKLEAQMVEARLSALQAQIEPHFLFNTLANVKRLYETAPSRGREMLASLIDYLKAALPSMRQAGSTVGREFELARSFLTILQMRMGERLRFSIRAEHGLEQARMPPMVLATLVENAVKHGLSRLPEGGSIDVAARFEGENLLLEVGDDGAGFSASAGTGVGLANTRSRLAALYGARASLSLASRAPRGVIAAVRLPLSFEYPGESRVDPRSH
jgi:sensor histidine kinase YesM